ncbi:basic region leucine zipper [Necator americanus]|uniref:Basic region leucine zipper n=1 Tax=Necator americanus TaxID=51031 RepID=W2TWA2_NECAM|nr:basic region leucine zipper [Necator americanus]ETN85336.1 basic region leucine zipper [Necator americanus]
MSESSCASYAIEQELFDDVCLPNSAVDPCWVWGAEETSFARCPEFNFDGMTMLGKVHHKEKDKTKNALRRFVVAKRGLIVDASRSKTKESVFLSGPSSTLPSLPYAKSQTSPSCDPPPRLVHSHNALVSADEGLLLENSPQIESTLPHLLSNSSPQFTSSPPLEHQFNSTYSQYSDYESSYTSGNSFYCPSSSSTISFSSSNSVSSVHENNDFASWSGSTCSENDINFGAGIYSEEDGLTTSHSSKCQFMDNREPPDFSFIDEIYESVAAEIDAEKAAFSCLQSSINEKTASTISLSVGQPLTIIGADGKEFRVVVEEVEQNLREPKRRTSSTLAMKRQIPLSSKRAERTRLTNTTVEEMASRKREQNRRAAERYRQKHRVVKDFEKEEKKRLEKRNVFLRSEATRLQKEIMELKTALLGTAGRTGSG